MEENKNQLFMELIILTAYGKNQKQLFMELIINYYQLLMEK